MSKPDKSALRDLQQIPGVGRKIAEDLCNLGFRTVQDLQNQDPEELYHNFVLKKACMSTDVRFMCFVVLYILHPARNTILNC